MGGWHRRCAFALEQWICSGKRVIHTNGHTRRSFREPGTRPFPVRRLLDEASPYGVRVPHSSPVGRTRVARDFSPWERPILPFFCPPGGRTDSQQPSSAHRAGGTGKHVYQGLKSLATVVRPPGGRRESTSTSGGWH